MSNKPQDVNSREYWKWAVNNPVEAGLNARQVNAMKESLDLTDPSYWEKVMADPDAHGFAREHAAQLANHFLKERKAREPTDDEVVNCDAMFATAEFNKGVKGKEVVERWVQLSAVLPFEAALLLAEAGDPSLYPDCKTLPDMGDDFKLLNRAFSDVARDNKDRSLIDWIAVAEVRGMNGSGLDGWKACCHAYQIRAVTQAAPVETESNAGGELDFSLLATREQLIAAFGTFTKMDMSWFNKLEPTHALHAARKVVGKGGRGHIIEPFFCPYEVMQWLIGRKRRKGKPMNQQTGWRMLKAHFPKAYAAHSDYDPNGN